MLSEDRKELLKKIPQVSEVLNKIKLDAPHELKVSIIREVLSNLRKDILSGKLNHEPDISKLTETIIKKIEYSLSPSLKRVINATGVVIHTNLGRSLLPKEILHDLTEIASHYSNLEFNLESGKRGSRYSHVEKIICEITGGEAALVVNNNAGAVLIVLDTLAKDNEVIVSRGELVEIGGSFRIPDVMRRSGATLVEVGTTNRTHIHDYENAITNNTVMLMKVHQSNFYIGGFTKQVSIRELRKLADKYGLILFEDLGSGCFIDFSKYGLRYEPTAQESLRNGCDIVSFSGDKLLGGPQAGIIVGKRELVNKIKKNPLNRALRIDKLTLVSLERILMLYRDLDNAVKVIPTLRMILEKPDKLHEKANKLLTKIKALNFAELDAKIISTVSKVGGGALPNQNLRSFAVKIKPLNRTATELEEFLRNYKTPIIARLMDDSLILDVRTIQDDEDEIILKALRDFLS